MTTKAPITKVGFAKLEAELKHLKTVERPAISEKIGEAADHGDLKENAEYHAAREQQGFIEGRIAQFEDWVARAQVIDVASLSGSRVVFGATVELYDNDTEEESTYQIVGEYEAKIESGRLSITSPLARGLIGKEEGDVVDVTTPGGKKSYEVLAVRFEG